MFQKRKEHGLCDKQVNSLSSLDLQKTQLSSKLHLVSISIPTLTGIFFLPFFSLILVHFQPWLKKFRIIVLSPTQITQMSVYEISLTEKDEPMLITMRFCIVIVSCFSLHFFRALAAPCVLYNRAQSRLLCLLNKSESQTSTTLTERA